VVTAVVGYFYRRSYNLTHAESGGSKHITPDFLKVDKDKRKAAEQRGAAYDAVLDAREAAGPAATAASVDKLRSWTRLAAVSTAILAVVTTIFGTLKNVDTIQEGLNQFSSWDRFTQLVSQNKAGAVVAFAVIGSNIIVFVKTLKKTPEKS
jgi:hypothetical protein